jgi:hydrogenase/urease accessory protein HupE
MKFRLNLIAFFIFTFSLCFAAPVLAHNDTMAASRWFFGSDRIAVVMEIGPAVLAQLKGIKEGHHLIETCSEVELREVLTRVIQPYLDQNLTVSVNDKRYPVQVTRLDRKSDTVWDMWLAVNGVSFSNPVNPVTVDYRLLFEETDGTHINLAYLYRYDSAADAVPKYDDDTPYLTRTTFDANSHLWEFAMKGSATAAAQGSVRKSLWENVSEFISIGIKHILGGYDHIAFLLALIVIGLSVKEVLKIVTAFTIAHSVTLLLAALQIVTLNSRFVEIVIALSICYVALENLLRKQVNYRWLITFGFGLIHGFGFASGLQELIVGKSDLLVSVLAFNVGVEAGQLLIFFILLPVLLLLGKKFSPKLVTSATSVVVFAFGFTWLLERVFDLKLLSL